MIINGFSIHVFPIYHQQVDDIGLDHILNFPTTAPSRAFPAVQPRPFKPPPSPLQPSPGATAQVSGPRGGRIANSAKDIASPILSASPRRALKHDPLTPPRRPAPAHPSQDHLFSTAAATAAAATAAAAELSSRLRGPPPRLLRLRSLFQDAFSSARSHRRFCAARGPEGRSRDVPHARLQPGQMQVQHDFRGLRLLHAGLADHARQHHPQAHP